MPVTMNARSAEDRAAAKEFLKSLSHDARARDIDLHFATQVVTVTDAGDEVVLKRTAFDAWRQAGYPYNSRGPDLPALRRAVAATQAPPEETQSVSEPIKPQPKPAAKPRKAAAAKSTKPKRAPKTVPIKSAPPPPPPPPEPVPAEERLRFQPPPDSFLQELASTALHLAQEERQGNLGRNAARFQRGELMLRLEAVSKSARVPMKAMLEDLNQQTLVLASANDIHEVSLISESEMNDTKAVVGAFGSSGEFRLVDQINPVTGEPLARDDGEPFELPITELTINKLRPLVEFANDTDFDTLLSFAYGNSEKTVKLAKRVAKQAGRPISTVIKDVNALRVEAESPLGLGPIRVQPSEAIVLDSLREMIGEPTQEDVGTIKTSKAWIENVWVPLRALTSQLARLYFPSAVNQTNGEVSNVFVLERTIGQMFNLSEDVDESVQRLLLALIRSGDLTQKQAETFLNTHQITPDGTFQEASAEADAQTLAASGVLDDDLDFDEPTIGDEPDFDDDDFEE